jgi:hypothetical protein
MMNDSRGPGQPAPRESLCPGCSNVQVITNDRGSRFYLCRLSATDKRFPKYPPQPVIICAGYVRAAPSSLP